MAARATPDFCPVCGAAVPARAPACPECGACSDTGWSETARYDSLDLPDADFDYAQFVKDEFGPASGRAVIPRGLSRIWWALAWALLLAGAVGFVWLVAGRF